MPLLRTAAVHDGRRWVRHLRGMPCSVSQELEPAPLIAVIDLQGHRLPTHSEGCHR